MVIVQLKKSEKLYFSGNEINFCQYFLQSALKGFYIEMQGIVLKGHLKLAHLLLTQLVNVVKLTKELK